MLSGHRAAGAAPAEAPVGYWTVPGLPDSVPFVFEDPTGHRWRRIKGVAFVMAIITLALGAVITAAILVLAPGRTHPWIGPLHLGEQVLEWPQRMRMPDTQTTAPGIQAIRSANGFGSSQAPPTAAPTSKPGAVAGPFPTKAASPAPTASVMPRPTPTPAPKQTPPPRTLPRGLTRR